MQTTRLSEEEHRVVIGPEHDLSRPTEPSFAAYGGGRSTNHFPAGRLSVSFIGGACAGRTALTLVRERTLIGRDEECEIVLEGETVSRRHCEIRQCGASFVLVDQSRNGTLLNGQRVDQAPWRDGDQIRVGTNILLVHFASGAITRALFSGKATTPHRHGAAAPIADLSPQIVVKGLEEGVTQPFAEDRITIGRRLDNHLVLEADNISRQHLAIERKDEEYFVLDLESANGTFLNEQRIERAPLRDGDRVRFGNFTMTVSLRERDCILNFKRVTKQ